DEFSLFEEEEDVEVEYTLKEEKKFFEINLQSDGVYNVTGDGIKRLFDMTDFDSDYARMRFARQLRTYGLDDELRRLGVKNGDTVRIFDFEFEFID
ncbi:MAG: Obg family GTPase CgtA, partial [Anaeroplasmataceae bacterium]|nr:Obg family GTPase CgtA [Anaeroplasmataceae bacterium]